MTTEIVQVSEVEAFLVESQSKIQGLLPKHITAERMIRLAIHACESNPKLLLCSKASLLGALIEASEVGLEPIGVLGEAALIPYGKVATFQPMYKGLIKLARQAGNVIDIQAECVGENDEFDFYHATPHDVLHHRPSLRGRGEWIGAWARAILPEGHIKMLYYDLEKIERIRMMSKEPNGMMWGNHWDEGAKKTVIKALCKTLPQSPELARAIDIDNRVEVEVEIEKAPIMQMPRRLSESQRKEELPPKAQVVPPECPEHGAMRLVPAGTTKGGKSYPAFYGCMRGCDTKGVNQKEWVEEQAARGPVDTKTGEILEEKEKKEPAVTKERKEKPKDKGEVENKGTAIGKGYINDEQIQKIMETAREVGISSTRLQAMIEADEIEQLEEIPADQFDAWIKRLEALKA